MKSFNSYIDGVNSDFEGKWLLKEVDSISLQAVMLAKVKPSTFGSPRKQDRHWKLLLLAFRGVHLI